MAVTTLTAVRAFFHGTHEVDGPCGTAHVIADWTGQAADGSTWAYCTPAACQRCAELEELAMDAARLQVAADDDEAAMQATRAARHAHWNSLRAA